MKRGQVTIFVLVGFILVIVLSLLFTAAAEINKKYGDAKKNQFIAQDYNEGMVRTQIDSCMREAIEESSIVMGANAGYLSSVADLIYGENGPLEYIVSGGVNVPVLFNRTGIYFLSVEEIESRMCDKVHVDLANCFDASILIDVGLDVNQVYLGGTIDSSNVYCNSFIDNNSIAVKTNYSVFIQKDEFSSNITGFSLEEKVPLGYLLSKASDFAVFVSNNANETTLSLNLSSACIPHPDFSVEIIDGNSVKFVYPGVNGALPFSLVFGFKDYSLFGQCN